MSLSTSPEITLWIWSLRAVVAVNLAVWAWTACKVARDAVAAPDQLAGYRRRLLWLSSLFVFGCAFRSIWPRADVQRITLFGGWISAVMVGRSVATVAEIAFMAQWALVLRAGTPPGTRDFGWWVGRTLVPVIAVAEAFSWYAVLTTDFIGNVLEQSTWTFASALVVVAAVQRTWPEWRVFGQTTAAMIVPYIAFMSLSDVPMYFRRWRMDQARGRTYLSLIDGIRDATTRVVVTRQWNLWHDEIAWMTLYFSAGVWVSLWLVRRSPSPVAAASPNAQKSHAKFAS